MRSRRSSTARRRRTPRTWSSGMKRWAKSSDVGSGVTGLAPGDLAVLMVRRPCPHDGCAPCRRGRPDFCITGDFTERGIKGAHGYMTEIRR